MFGNETLVVVALIVVAIIAFVALALRYVLRTYFAARDSRSGSSPARRSSDES